MRALSALSSALLFVPVVAALTAPAQARDITGEMAYRERMALVDDAQLVVELRGPAGVVAEARIESKGQQVPLRFAVVAPDNGDYTLRGAIFVGGKPEWVSDPVAVKAGEEALDLGLVLLKRHTAMAFGTMISCGEVPVEVGFIGDNARLRAEGEVYELKPVAAASGAKFSDGATPETSFWSKGNGAIVTLKGKELAGCQPMIPDQLLPITARGNEPSWRLDLSDQGFDFQPSMDAAHVTGALPQPVATSEGLRLDLADKLVVTLDRHVCRDSMSGMPFPVAATVSHDGKVLKGCAGRPEDLLAGNWHVTQMGAMAVPAEVELTIGFDTAAGRVFGKSACNRYNAGFTLTGEGLSFSPAASTMMACPDELMKLEQEFQKQLGVISGFDITDAGVLELRQGDAAVILAERP